MKRSLTCILFILLSLSVSGQTPFQGGSGDGFATAQLAFETVATSNNTILKSRIFPSPATSGSIIRIDIDEDILGVEMYAVDGAVINVELGHGMTSLWRLPEVPEGLYFLRVFGRSGREYQAKVIVTGS